MPTRQVNREITARCRDNAVQNVRLLGELCACGLTKAQYKFLQESADMSKQDVDEVLERADRSYDAAKEILARNRE